ncbi:MAG TPA: bifunctional DNA-formamidopyrimidine glycosylase/DNA-(apurinic or apyrimidinic site) lyase [Candidatus Moranbacteria bacterium]|nr:bifunctional DNA-formamidopyrimidine glycosylase/DNA-(apurinic or apyrimidinic site) lyase [Candidatus Moranbacteria bacterium]HRZ33503.1 bifunctional DNA-formamidopyrimidine glycosylase/DNA-(apurinic or apyrimidinic site) lyase [Candidatus Moranbacteria bacterium]
MPELPEVQTIVSDLNKKIVGYTIADFWSDWPKAIRNKTLANFKKEIKNRKILGVRRIGKNIFIDLSDRKTLYIHLKMTGHLLVKPEERNKRQKTKDKNYFNDKVNSYIHHIWKIKKNKNKINLEFSDVRKFAKIVLEDTDRINNLKEINKLGVDATSKEFALKKFNEILDKRKNKSIGLVLMEQELIAGIGNIYRSEILYSAGILPQRKIASLSKNEINKIYKATLIVLKKAIKMRGTSDSDYRDTDGAPGKFQKALRVYRRAGKNCIKCATIIKRMTLGQRSAFYCPKCQN